MPDVTLWWKPGCATNTRQIRLLEAAGCRVAMRDLLAEAWTPERLASFFGVMPVPDWFNPAAPAVKSGAVEPQTFGPDTALLRLVADPILIRRPLIKIGGARRAGFDARWLAGCGIELPDGPVPEGCSHRDSAAHCAPPASERPS